MFVSGVMSKAFVKVLDDLGFHTDAVPWLSRTCRLCTESWGHLRTMESMESDNMTSGGSCEC